MLNISTLLLDEKLNPEVLEDVCKTLYYSTGISATVLDDSNNALYSYGSNASVVESFTDVLKGLPNHIYKTQANTEDGVGVFKSVYNFSFVTAVIANKKKYYGCILLGPVLTQPPSEHIINEILKRNNMPLSKRSIIENAIKNITIINSPRLYYVSKTLGSILYNNHEVETDTFSLNFPLDSVAEEPAFNPSTETANYNYGLERLFLSKVSSGDVETVKTLFNDQIKTLYFTNLGSDHLRPIKNTAIIFASLLARASINGGVEPDLALKLSAYYTRMIEDIFRYNEIITTIEKMACDFTEQVLQTSEVNHVSVVKKVSKYIHAHLSEPIRLNDVAKYVDLSPNYFSSLFKREMGIAFADYVNEIRIKESQFLLETTDYSIVDIAIAVGFNNQNYFTTIFRKHTGTTPKQFRMKTVSK